MVHVVTSDSFSGAKLLCLGEFPHPLCENCLDEQDRSSLGHAEFLQCLGKSIVTGARTGRIGSLFYKRVTDQDRCRFVAMLLGEKVLGHVDQLPARAIHEQPRQVFRRPGRIVPHQGLDGGWTPIVRKVRKGSLGSPKAVGQTPIRAVKLIQNELVVGFPPAIFQEQHAKVPRKGRCRGWTVWPVQTLPTRT